MIQLHCQKSPLWQVTLFPDGYETRSLTLCQESRFFFLSQCLVKLEIQNSVRMTAMVIVFLCEFTKRFSLSRTGTNLLNCLIKIHQPWPAVTSSSSELLLNPIQAVVSVMAKACKADCSVTWPTELRSPAHFTKISNQEIDRSSWSLSIQPWLSD